jgi:predicted nucleic acid-binding Zn ribbon protein
MPTYTFKDENTGEVFDKFMKISELDTFREENPHLKNIIHAPELISGGKSAHAMAGSEWNDHLNRMKKGSGKDATIKT